MKFGILYNIDYHEEVHGSPSSYYGQIIDQVVRAEEVGYRCAWFGEHHYAAYSFGSPATIVTAAAARTSRAGDRCVPAAAAPTRAASEAVMPEFT